MEAEKTILFADICNSTGITEAVGDAESRRHFAQVLGDLVAIGERYGGTLVKTIGDEIMCSFEDSYAALLAAVDMQRAVSVRPAIGGVPSAIKVGVHSGAVILEDGDVYGDVVNIAARVVSMAAGEQVLTTTDSLQGIDPRDVPFRSLGQHTLRGREGELHVFEVLWRGETVGLTAVAPKLDPLPAPEIILRMGDDIVASSAGSGDPITLGRGTESTVVVPGSSASRAHARIERRGSRFYLEDHSTNGTYLKIADGDEIFVHRDQVLLQGSGRIRLGEPLSIRGPLDIEFEMAHPQPGSPPSA
jgi:class 3 adenylate cyclase